MGEKSNPKDDQVKLAVCNGRENEWRDQMMTKKQ